MSHKLRSKEYSFGLGTHFVSLVRCPHHLSPPHFRRSTAPFFRSSSHQYHHHPPPLHHHLKKSGRSKSRSDTRQNTELLWWKQPDSPFTNENIEIERVKWNNRDILPTSKGQLQKDRAQLINLIKKKVHQKEKTKKHISNNENWFISFPVWQYVVRLEKSTII